MLYKIKSASSKTAACFSLSNSLIVSLMRKVTITCMMPFYIRTILAIANDVKYFNNCSIIVLDIMSFNFLLSIADWTTRHGTTQIVWFY